MLKNAKLYGDKVSFTLLSKCRTPPANLILENNLQLTVFRNYIDQVFMLPYSPKTQLSTNLGTHRHMFVESNCKLHPPPPAMTRDAAGMRHIFRIFCPISQSSSAERICSVPPQILYKHSICQEVQRSCWWMWISYKKCQEK